MTLTFISNYINHHQIPFSNACYERLGEAYHFIQTEPMEQERLAMGWSKDGEKLPYVFRLYEQEDICRKLIMESDVLLAGWSGREDLVQERLKAGKLTIRISERIYREGQWKAISPRGLLHKYQEHTRYRKHPVYLLCAGAYVPSDFHLIRAYPDKMFRWGYFPETRYYEERELFQGKETGGEISLVWAGRFIPCKHPECMVSLARDLREKPIHIHMVGGGELEGQLKALAKEYRVEEKMTFHGFRTPEEVRAVMEKSQIHLCTSDWGEGWGAVVNEAMNSGCAVVASLQAGAVPYLIRHKKNGMVYPDHDYEKMKEAVEYLLERPKERERMGRAAYHTITECWNASHAAEELLRMSRALLEGCAVPAGEGPCSPAPVVAPGKMYQWMLKESERNEFGRGKRQDTDQRNRADL